MISTHEIAAGDQDAISAVQREIAALAPVPLAAPQPHVRPTGRGPVHAGFSLLGNSAFTSRRAETVQANE